MGRVRLAVVGAGLIGEKHARLVSGHSGTKLVGVCDVDVKHRSTADALGVPFYQHVEELLERERPEGAIVATPNHLHASVAEVCARQAVHILVEKPIGDTLEAASRIVEVAEKNEVQVLVGQHRRHNPLIREARTIVKDGTLGKLVAVSMLWALLKPADYFAVGWRSRRPGGGPIFINLIHELDTLRFICGEISQVCALASAAVRKFAVEDSMSLSLAFENGALGSVVASDATPAPWSYEATSGENPYYFSSDENCYHFLGTLGSLAFPQLDLWRYASEGRSGWQYPLEKSRRQIVAQDPLLLQLEHFCRVIRYGEKPLVDGGDGRRSLEVALAVLESAQHQMPIALPEYNKY